MGAWVNEQGILNFVDKLKLSGLNTNFAVKTNYHVRVNPGTLQVDRDNYVAECN